MAGRPAQRESDRHRADGGHHERDFLDCGDCSPDAGKYRSSLCGSPELCAHGLSCYTPPSVAARSRQCSRAGSGAHTHFRGNACLSASDRSADSAAQGDRRRKPLTIASAWREIGDGPHLIPGADGDVVGILKTLAGQRAHASQWTVLGPSRRRLLRGCASAGARLRGGWRCRGRRWCCAAALLVRSSLNRFGLAFEARDFRFDIAARHR